MLPTTSPTQTLICPGLGPFLSSPSFPQRGKQILPQVPISHSCYSSSSHTSLIISNPFCIWRSLISPHVQHLFIEHLLCSRCFTQIGLILMSMRLSSNYSHCTDEEFCQRSKKLSDLPKTTQPLIDREGNQVQICQAPNPVSCLLFHAASLWQHCGPGSLGSPRS